MSSMDRFDNVIKGRMDSYESAVPNGMWEKIETARAVEETGRKKFFFLITALLLTGTMGYLLFENNADNTLAEKTAIEINKEIAGINSSETAATKNTETAFNRETTTDLSSSNTIDFSEQAKEDVIPAITPALLDKLADRRAASKANDKISSLKKKSNSDFSLVNKSFIKDSKTQSSGQLISSTKTFEIISLSDSEPNFIGEVTQLTGPNNEGSSQKLNRVSTTTASSKKGKLNWKPLTIKKGIINPIHTNAKIKSNVGCVDFGGNKRKGGISFDIYGGPDLALKSLNTNSAEHLDILAAREDSESSLISMHSGIRVNRHFRNGLIASGGIMFTQVNEQFDWKKIVGTQTIIGESAIVDTIPNPTGEGVLVVSQYPITTIDSTRIVSWQNKYQFVDVPLTIGYEIVTKKMALGIHAGPMLNMGFYQRGKLLSIQDEEPRSINNPSQDELFKNQLGLGAIFRIGLAYNLTDELQIIAESNSRYYLNQTNTSNNPINQSYSISGFSTGLRIQF